ncbi:MAG: hypothetical protein M3Q58_16050 [Bacteroidota bacterium]|nr:hypothetical protein [Bacteroidota bacterium]
MNFFNIFFSLLNSSGIAYAITGRTENYPEIIHSDIDIIILNEDVHNFWSFLRSLKELDWIQVISHENSGHYCVVTIAIGNNHFFLKPDFCSDYFRNGLLFLKSKHLLINRIYDPRGFYLLAPNQEFIYYVLKKIDKGEISHEQWDHLKNNWFKDPNGCINTISSFFSTENQKLIKDSFNNNNFRIFEDKILELKKDFKGNLKINLFHFFKKLKNRFERIVKPTGLVVAFMGPDGAGKTTIIEGVKLNIREVFRQTKQFHLFPKELKGNVPTTNPHSLKARGYVGSLAKLIYFAGLYNFGYFLKIFPLKVRSTLVIFDRYYQDILVDPKRYRHGAGKFWLKLMSFFVPKPDIWILLDAPADVIQQRKSEVTFEETYRQTKEYQILFGELKNAHVVNANQTSDLVIFDAEKIIIEYLKQRTSSRYKNY